jgi:hypothetical protein
MGETILRPEFWCQRIHGFNFEEMAMSEEISKLKARIAELERQNAALQPDPQQPTKQTLERQTRDILQYFFDTGESITVREIVTQLGIAQSVTEYHLAILGSQDLIVIVANWNDFLVNGDTKGFKITPLGTQLILNTSAS